MLAMLLCTKLHNPDDYSSIFQENLSGCSDGTTTSDYGSDQSTPVQHVHESGEFVKSSELVLFEIETMRPQVRRCCHNETAVSEGDIFAAPTFTCDESVPFIRSIIARYPYPDEVVTERTDEDYKALFDNMPSPKK